MQWVLDKPCKLSASAFLLAIVSTLLVLSSSSGEAAPDSGTFFLKATKNVPRIGRRSGDGAESTFFIKSSPKSIPRIGRRGSPWANELTEMHENAVNPWFRSGDNAMPTRVTRTGPSSLGLLLDGSARVKSSLMERSTPQESEVDDVPWHFLSSEQEEDFTNAGDLYHYDLEDDEEVETSAAQLLAPPPAALHFTRLPYEGAYPARQRRSGTQL